MLNKRERLVRAYLLWKWQGPRGKHSKRNSTVTKIMKARTERSIWWREKQSAFAAVDSILAELRFDLAERPTEIISGDVK